MQGTDTVSYCPTEPSPNEVKDHVMLLAILRKQHNSWKIGPTVYTITKMITLKWETILKMKARQMWSSFNFLLCCDETEVMVTLYNKVSLW